MVKIEKIRIILYSLFVSIFFIFPTTVSVVIISGNLSSSLQALITHEIAQSTSFSFNDLIYSTIFAPIIEEIIFRYIIFNWLLKKYSAKKSIFISSFLFAVIHPVFLFLSAFSGGVIACLLYLRTKSLGSCIVYHMLYNLTLEAIGVFSSNSTSLSFRYLDNIVYLITPVLSFSIIFIVEHNKRGIFSYLKMFI